MEVIWSRFITVFIHILKLKYVSKSNIDNLSDVLSFSTTIE